MRNRDWSLVFFTTMSQWSVGIVICFTILGYFDKDSRLIFDTGITLINPVLAALVLIGVATFISFLHLGNPSNAPKALNNFSGSWLSREILALGCYSISLSIVIISSWRQWGTESLYIMLALSSVFGVVFLWTMIRIYVMPTIPAWNSWYTYLSFVATAICLGLLTIHVFQQFGWTGSGISAARILTAPLLVALIAEMVSGIMRQFQLKKMHTGLGELVFGQGVFYKVYLFRMTLLASACLLTGIFVFKSGLFSEYGSNGWVFTLAVLIVLQELTGRLLFYSSYFRTGV